MIEDIVNELITQGHDVLDSCEESVSTKHSFAGGEIVIEGVLGASFPFDTPKFYLLDRAKYGLLAHVGWPSKGGNQGLICDGSSDGLALNAAKASVVYCALLKRCVDTVLSVLSDSEYNQNECLREFLGHWNYSLNADHAKAIIYLADSKPSVVSELRIARPTKDRALVVNRKFILYDDELGGISKNNLMRGSINQRPKTVQGKAFIIRLPKLPLPPSPGQSITDWWILLLESMDEVTARHLVIASKRNKAKELFLVIEAPYQDQVSRFALYCETPQKSNLPLRSCSLEGWTINSSLLESHTRDYLLPRGGSGVSMQKKKVLLVGCGSIGCLIADQMAASGIGNLQLNDHDTFCQDNLYRHSLSMAYDGFLKSRAVAIELSNKYPFAQVDHHSDKLLDIDNDLLRETDLVIVAVGNTTHEVEFNKRMLASDIRTPIINTWLEPYGIGGHATLTLNDGGSGCYGCTLVRPNDPSELGLLPNLNFVAENQAIAKNLGTCGTLYLPYSQIHAAQTATIASKLALQVLSGKLNTSSKVSWSCGFDNKPIELAKTRHTQRFVDFQSSLQELPLHSPHCPYCND